jgi:hypothetical protein
MDPMELETRNLPSEIAGDGKTLTGMIPYDTPAELTIRGRKFTEVIRPGAFSRMVAAKADVIATFNHDPNRLLGRTSSGTLRFESRANGLAYFVDLPTSANDLRELIARGDLKGSSFTFTPRSVDRWTGTSFRELIDLDVIELGPVVLPAYGSSGLSIRSVAGNDRMLDVTIGLMEREG